MTLFIKRKQLRLLPIRKARGKYYTRIRWGSSKYGRNEVRFPLDTDKLSVAEHRRDIVSATSLRGKIIKAYESNGQKGVENLKEEIDWYTKSGTIVSLSLRLLDAVQFYHEYLLSQRLSIVTINIYITVINEFITVIGNRYVDKITPRQFTIFKNKNSQLSPYTVNRKMRALQTFFNWMYDEGRIDNPVRIKKLPVINPPVNFFSDAEFEKILSCVKSGFPYAQAKMAEEDRELFIDAYRLYWNTGLRLAEPFDNELKMDDDGYRLKIIGSTTKNSYLRYVHLTEQQGITIIQMNEWLDRQLKRRKNRYGTIQVFSRVFKKALNKSHLKGKFHDLRKSFATRLYFLTGEEFSLCHVLGHTDTSMTKQYTNVDKVILAKAYPKIHAIKNRSIKGENTLRGHVKGDTVLYSNFGFGFIS
jgi:integrase/recombinase XerD